MQKTKEIKDVENKKKDINLKINATGKDMNSI